MELDGLGMYPALPLTLLCDLGDITCHSCDLWMKALYIVPGVY